MILQSSSIEYLRITATADAPLDFPLEVALVAVGAAPGEDDWVEAEWVDSVAGATRKGRVLLIGSEAVDDSGTSVSVTLEAGRYDVWARLLAHPEKVVRKVNVYVTVR